MNIFKGKEELEEMDKSDVINMMKDEVFPNRSRGGLVITKETEIVQRKTWRGEWYDYELTSPSCRERTGTDMSEHRPTIDGREYTWGELSKYPATLLKVLAYRLWQQENGSEEE
tara:strand:+ start:261 stop:602 length:342 start_codon:yes stop_codon:yes gene_type:complete